MMIRIFNVHGWGGTVKFQFWVGDSEVSNEYSSTQAAYIPRPPMISPSVQQNSIFSMAAEAQRRFTENSQAYQSSMLSQHTAFLHSLVSIHQNMSKD